MQLSNSESATKICSDVPGLFLRGNYVWCMERQIGL